MHCMDVQQEQQQNSKRLPVLAKIIAVIIIIHAQTRSLDKTLNEQQPTNELITPNIIVNIELTESDRTSPKNNRISSRT